MGYENGQKFIVTSTLKWRTEAKGNEILRAIMMVCAQGCYYYDQIVVVLG